jgi:SAM-dependent methyltransferase
VLELACGTGLWTERLLRTAHRVTAVDSSAEMLRRNALRVGSRRTRHVQADLFDWTPDLAYDGVFFGFWLSHVPDACFVGFWEMVASALKAGGNVFFVDSLYNPDSTAGDHELGDPSDPIRVRRLNDGSTYRVLKLFHQPDDLARRLQDLGWEFEVRTTASYFLYGKGARAG